MVPRENGNNTYANFLEEQTKSIMVFLYWLISNFMAGFGLRIKTQKKNSFSCTAK